MGNLIISTKVTLHGVMTVSKFCKQLGCCLQNAQLALNTMLISEGSYLSGQLGREVTADEVRERSVSLSTPGD